jgi:hypothetical protein
MENIDILSQINELPAHLQKEIEEHILFLVRKQLQKKEPTPRKAGFAKGKIKMLPNFEEPLDEFNDYI